MFFTLNSRILLSLASIAAAGALIVGATFAFFSDSETSTGNTFAAGTLDLKVDSEAHYAGLVCTGTTSTVWADDPDDPSPTTRPDLVGNACDGTWVQGNLGPTNKFFNLTDIKPGDNGEDTISLHVIDNDAWGRLVISDPQDLENGCGGEESSVDANCVTEVDPNGELREALLFRIWLDEGATPGFQGAGDATEGDNIRQGNEPVLVAQGTLDDGGETLNIWQGLSAYRSSIDGVCDIAGDSDGDGQGGTSCQGLANDGRLVGDLTYYFGLDWELPTSTGNNVQTDSLIANMTFDAVQHRNNPTQTGF